MMFQFSLYGFLKNLRFFEAFFLLFLRSKGLMFTEIGILFAFKEVCVNILNVPLGAVADLYGRKKSLILGLMAYVVSFILFSFSSSLPLLYLAMFLFGIGESFRAGTHKAMIFDYLRSQNRLNEKTKVYGFTRSWSQKGSALSVLIGALILYLGTSYDKIFLFSIIPYLLGMINIWLYPDFLDKKNETGADLKGVFRHLWQSTKKCWQLKPLRALITQSTIYEGQYRSVKDYLQILIQHLALLIPALSFMVQEQKIALFSAGIYFLLYLGSSYAAQSSHLFVKLCKGEERSLKVIWLLTFVLLLLSSFFTWLNYLPLSIILFMLLYNLQNIMRPIMTARYDDLAKSEEQATVLSIESQANSIGIFLMAPVLGYLADHQGLPSVFLFCALILGAYMLGSHFFSKTHDRESHSS